MRMSKILLATAMVALATPAFAVPLILTGNYIKVGIGDRGTLGVGGNTSPGLLHDPTGTQNFGINDYITPGTPHESFSLVSSEFGFSTNDNYTGVSSAFTSATGPVLLTGAAAMGYTNAATWTGANAFASVTNSYFFNPNDERILIMTTITAISSLTNLAFSRGVDPDPDVNTTGNFNTNNQRGNSLFGVTDFVGAAGASTGLTIALVNLNGDTYAHNTYIDTSSCCSAVNPNTVLLGSVNNSSADNSINLGYRIGSLAAGASATLTYSYSVGSNISVVGPPTGAVPEPATWAMMIGGFGLVGAGMRRRRMVASAA